MPSPEKSAAIARNRQGVKRGETPEPPKQASNELDNPERQMEILRPKPTPVKIGKYEFILKPLTAWNSIEFTGLVQQVIADVFAGKTEMPNTATIMGRMGGIVAERYGKKLVPHIASATGAKDDEIGAKSASIMEAIEKNPDEAYGFLALAFVVLCTQNKSFERITGKGKDSKN